MTPVIPRHRIAVVLLALAGAGLTACGVLQANAAPRSTPEQTRMAVAMASGWTKSVTTAHYLVVVNVLPGEHMMTTTEMQMDHPTEGELIIDGKGNPEGVDVRHVEAHIYDRTTGRALTGLVPRITLTNRTTGETIDVPPTLMQDMNIGPLDLHFGNNVKVTGDSDISVRVVVNGEEVTVDGHLD